MNDQDTRLPWPRARMAQILQGAAHAVPGLPWSLRALKSHARPARCTTHLPVQALRWQGLRMACWLLAGVLALALSGTRAQAWTPFERKTLYQEVDLSAVEARNVQFAAGWSAQSDTELLIEVKNNLPGPLACLGATVHLQSGSTVSKSFVPRLYVPNAASRQGAVAGVKKGQMKDFVVTCHCWKKPGDSACGNPSSK